MKKGTIVKHIKYGLGVITDFNGRVYKIKVKDGYVYCYEKDLEVFA